MSSNELARVAAVAVTSMDDMTLGQMLARSGYFQDARDAAQAIVKVLAGRELGLGPIASMTGIYVVKGRVTLSANLIAAAIKRSGRYNYRVRRMDDHGCEIEFFEGRESIGVSTFTVDDAKNASLLSGDNWKKFPRNMYFARAMSNGAKWFTPDVFAGPVYTPDELGAGVNEEGEVIDTPSPPTITEEPAPPPNPERQTLIRELSELRAELHTLSPSALPPKPNVAALNIEQLRHEVTTTRMILRREQGPEDAAAEAAEPGLFDEDESDA